MRRLRQVQVLAGSGDSWHSPAPANAPLVTFAAKFDAAMTESVAAPSSDLIQAGLPYKFPSIPSATTNDDEVSSYIS